jgi:hypothetical protein
MVLDFEVLLICDRLAVGAGRGSTRAKQRLEAPGKRQRPSKMEAMPLPHLTCFPKDPVRVIVFFCNILSWQRTWENPSVDGNIYIPYIYMSDEQNPRRGVLYKRMIGVCCCKFVVRFAWEAQESARAGARYINIVVLFCISEHLLL